jgi:transketolase
LLESKGILEPSDLDYYSKPGSNLGVHPTSEIPGIYFGTGSLGHGLNIGLGAAIIKKRLNKRVFVLLSDGEIQEGQVWEAAMFAAAKKVDNIIATIDVNGQQIDGSTAQVLNSGDWGAKWEAFGWTVLSMNGNDVDDIMKTMQDAKSKSGQGKPVVILMKTEMGNGVDFMMHSHKWHGVAPNDEQLTSALSQNEATLGDY